MNPTPSPVLKISLIHGLGTDLSMGSHFYMAYTGTAPTIAACTALAGDVATAWAAHLAPLLSDNGVLESVTVEDVSSSTGNSGDAASGASGSRSGSQVSNGAATVLNFKIARKYRGGKPKMFLPFGITTDVVNGNTWGSSLQSALNSDWPAFIAAVTGSTSGGCTIAAQVSVSYFSGSTTNSDTSKWAPRNRPAPRSTPVVDPVIATVMRGELGSQRKRLNA